MVENGWSHFDDKQRRALAPGVNPREHGKKSPEVAVLSTPKKGRYGPVAAID